MREVHGLGGIEQAAGQEIGASAWLEITQEMVDRFADTTLDHQWIHCDVERARRESPYGGPIAHGFLTLFADPRLSEPGPDDHRRVAGHQLRRGIGCASRRRCR